jgi:hypothetical protein
VAYEMYSYSAPMYALALCGAAELASAFSIAPIPLRTPARASASGISMMEGKGKGDMTGDVSRRSALALGIFGGISALSPSKVSTPTQHAAPVWPDAPLLAWSPACGRALQHHVAARHLACILTIEINTTRPLPRTSSCLPRRWPSTRSSSSRHSGSRTSLTRNPSNPAPSSPPHLRIRRVFTCQPFPQPWQVFLDGGRNDKVLRADAERPIYCSNVEATKESLGGDGDENELQEVNLAISLSRERFISCSSFSSFAPHRSQDHFPSSPCSVQFCPCAQTALRHAAKGQPISCKKQHPCLESADGQHPCLESADGALTTAHPRLEQYLRKKKEGTLETPKDDDDKPQSLVPIPKK